MKRKIYSNPTNEWGISLANDKSDPLTVKRERECSRIVEEAVGRRGLSTAAGPARVNELGNVTACPRSPRNYATVCTARRGPPRRPSNSRNPESMTFHAHSTSTHDLQHTVACVVQVCAYSQPMTDQRRFKPNYNPFEHKYKQPQLTMN